MTGAFDRRLLLGRALGVAAQLCAAGLLLTSAWLIVRAAEHPPVLYLMVAIVSVRFFGVVRTVLRYAERLVTHDVALRRVVDLRVAVVSAVTRRAALVVGDGRRGDVVRRVVADVDAVQDRLLRVQGPWVVAVATTAVVVAVVALVEPLAGLAVLLSSLGAMVGVRWLGRLATGGGDEPLTQARALLAADVSGSLRASADLVAAGLSTTPIRGRIDDVARLERRSARRAGASEALVLACTAAAVLAASWLTAGTDPVLVGIAVLAPLALAEPLEALADAERLRPVVDAAERRLDELLVAPEAIKPPVVASAPPVAWDLVTQDLAVGWDGAVADGIDLHLEPGGALVVTGPSGSGKSTLGLTLARVLPPVAGTVRLGGVDVDALDPAEVRRRVGLLRQDEMVFDTTVRENLRVADPDADDEAFVAALRDAGLGDWLATATEGLDTPLGEHGSRLSGGERQRLALARLLLGGHRVLVVDEPTEHLDAVAGSALLQDLLDLRPRVSVLVVTHDPTVVDAVVAAGGSRLALGPSPARELTGTVRPSDAPSA